MVVAGLMPASPAASQGGAVTAFFAEGTTRDGFRQTLWFLNTAASPITVTIEYQFGDGAPALERELQVPAETTVGIDPAFDPGVGPGRDISVAASSTARFTAARVIEASTFFPTTGPITGATSVSGIAAPALLWDLAEGSTLPGFQEFLTVQNPGLQAADIQVTYGLEGQPGVVTQMTVPPRSRVTLDVNSAGQAGPGQTGVAARVEVVNGVPVLVERPIYFARDLTGTGIVTDGAHVAPGSTPRDDWFFAEGTVLEGWDQFLVLFNPGVEQIVVAVNYLLEGADNVPFRIYSVAAGSRRTVQVFTSGLEQGIGRQAAPPPARGVSMEVRSFGGPVVAERVLYSQAALGGGVVNDGHVAPGASDLRTCVTFAVARTDGAGGSFVTLANPDTEDVDVVLDLYEAGTAYVTPPMVIPGQSRITVELGMILPGSVFGVDVVATDPARRFVAEAPWYFPTFAAADLGAAILQPTPC